MFNAFYPNIYIDAVYQCDFKDLWRQGYRGIIFDVDNTLVKHGEPANDESIKLFESLSVLGFETMLLSNNKEPRVKGFFEQVNATGYIFKAGKPSRKNYRKAMEIMKTNITNTIFIGDQLFTDIWGAKRTGLFTILVKPIHPKEEIQIIIKRKIENIVLYFYKKRTRGNLIMKIDGKTKVFGLIGNPVEHSFSPFIHNTIASLLGDNLIYEPFLVEDEGIAQAIIGAHALHIKGLNITVPFKQKVMNSLVKIDEEAKQIGAVNTLIRRKNGFEGCNTDMPGLYMAMQADEIKIEEETIIILGAGGAARAVAFMCAKYKAKRIYLLNRTLDKANLLATQVNSFYGSESVIPLALEDIYKIPQGKHLAIQATVLGLYPKISECITNDTDFYKKIHTGYDIIYNPQKTMFMKNVEAEGGKTFNGLKMLLYQAVLAYEYWNEKKISKEIIDEVYKKLQEELVKSV